MVSSRAFLSVFLCVVLLGCASGYGSSQSHIERAKAALTKEYEVDFAWAVNNARAVHPEQVAQLFAQSPHAAQLYSAGVLMLLPRITESMEISILRNNVVALAGMGAVPETTAGTITAVIDEHAHEGLSNGTLKFELKDHPESLGLMDSPTARRQVLQNTIDSTRNSEHVSGRQIEHLMVFASSDRATPTDKQFIEKHLPSLYIQKWELKSVEPIFPKFAHLRREQLASMRGNSSDATIGSHVWRQLSLEDQKRISDIYRVKELDPQSYGEILDVHTVNRSTAGSTAGSAVGSGIAQIAYIDRAFDRGSYSVWSDLGWGIVGGMIGSAANSAPVEEYQNYYTIKLADGELARRDVVGGAGARLAPGTCVLVSTLEPIPQITCEQDPKQLRAQLLGS